MSELVDIIISAVDEASEVFQSITGSAEEAQTSLEGMGSAAEDVPSDGISQAAEATDGLEQEAIEADDALTNMSNVITAFAGAEVFSGIADQLMDMADKAGTVQDSWTRMGLAAEGAGIDVGNMKTAVSDLSSETGRAGGQIRESFIQMTSAGISDMSTMQSLFKGASAQAFILGTDVESLANKFSGMAMKSTLSERTLKGTGITMQELGEAMGMTGATVDEVKDKWEELDVNQRAAALGMAASMNEGKEANEEYKNSWEGLQAQIDIAKGKLEVLVGKVLLPVLVPAMEIAGRVLDWLGNTISAVMDGPLGGLVSAIGSFAAGIVLAIPAIAAIQAGLAFFTASIWPAVVASWALLAPWLPWIALGAAIVYIIYEIGKAFGWWTDASSMIDAIGAGLQRLWSAFINHPDVQAILEVIGEAFNAIAGAIGWAWNALLEFFGVSTSGDFDIVRALIDGIGAAWNAIKAPIMFVINLIQNVINVFNQFRTGQMDLPTFIIQIGTLLINAYMSVFQSVIRLVIQFGSQMLSYAIRAGRNFLNGVANQIRQVPGRVFSLLMTVVARIRSAIQAWITAGVVKVRQLITDITSPFRGVADKISTALSNVAKAITKPFSDAYNTVIGVVDNIKSKVQEGMDAIGQLNPFAAGGETAAGGDTITSPAIGETGIIVGDSSVTIDHNLNVSLDLQNVPSHISTQQLVSALTDRKVLRELTSNSDFQLLDSQAKERLNLKLSRSRGV